VDNKNNRTDAEEAVANQAGGKLNQIKGKVKRAVGDLTDNGSLYASGAKDTVKGHLQESYGKLKEKEAELEGNLRDVDDNRV
jgi:uncharacterized protein YjbJ (UPF0337 family)